MTGITDGAGALSTYGLYAIVSALVICVIYLYKRTTSLEEKFREYVSQSGKDTVEFQKGLLEQTTSVLNSAVKAIEDSTDVIRCNNEIMADMREVMGRKHDDRTHQRFD